MTTRRRRSTELQERRIRAQFVKSPLYRVIHADGAWGGVTPHGHIRMGIYNEVITGPQAVTYEVSGTRTKELSREPARTSGPVPVTREMEADIVLTLSVARSLYIWLGDKIEQLEQATREITQTPEEQRDANSNPNI